MIATQMRNYKYFTFGANDAYGQPQMVEAEDTVKVAINLASQSVQENPLYGGAQYTGLSLNKAIDATYVIEYGDVKLKVLYSNPLGKYNQIFLARM